MGVREYERMHGNGWFSDTDTLRLAVPSPAGSDDVIERAHLKRRFHERLPDGCGHEELPKRDQEVAACDARQIKQGVGDLRRVRWQLR